MGQVKYKKVSKNLEKYIKKAGDEKDIRISVGKEEHIGEYYYLSPHELMPYSKQARKIFDSGEIEELANTIRSVGITTPLTVIASAGNKGKFEVVSGERRLKAAESVGVEKIPCIILKNDKNVEEIALIENIQRADLHPIEAGNALVSLVGGYPSISDLAKKVGKSRTTVSELISFSKIPDTIKIYLIERGIKNRDLLRRVSSLSNKEEMEQLLGINKKNPASKTKNILRIYLDNDEYKIQSRAIKGLDDKEREGLVNELRKLIVDISGG